VKRTDMARFASALGPMLLGAVMLLAAMPARASTEAIPFPAELRKDVDFWIRVYSEITTSEGFLHDADDLSIVYRKLEFAPDIDPRQRREAVDEERKKIESMLLRLASGASNLGSEEKRIREAFGKDANPARLRQAAQNVRFQLGQADRFREGLVRSGIWEGHIARTFAKLGLPPELAALPHVESSFDPSAYSKVGAAGMWQFMPGTGRLYLRIDDAVDERMDPFRATEAAAQLLQFNYNLLGSWPLALTAYNHGAAGMRRARDTMGTTDIVTIVRGYKSRSFGFASRNFYVSFLAALTIDRDPEKYFPGVTKRPEMKFAEVEMPSYMAIDAVQKALDVERAVLAELNPGLLRAVWEGHQYVPKGYRLRLPPEKGNLTAQELAQRVDPSQQFLGQPRPRIYVVRSGDTLTGVAARHKVGLGQLAALNGLSDKARLKVGQRLRLPTDAPAAPVAAVAAAIEAGEPGARATPAPRAPAPEKVAERIAERRAEEQAVAQAKQAAEEAEPVSATEARAEGPALAPGAPVASAVEAIDYSIGEDGTIRVAAEETLGHFADWLGVPASRLRSLNGLSAAATVAQGRKLRLDFSKVSREQFEQRRRAYHEALQAEFFAGHRIVGTLEYVVKSGDSLWNIAHRHGPLPTWLVAVYNPDVDFDTLRRGQRIVIPRVEALPPA
jgi:membrane-bound lytic murein transglycosylase D